MSNEEDDDDEGSEQLWPLMYAYMHICLEVSIHIKCYWHSPGASKISFSKGFHLAAPGVHRNK